jgi:hypothetical protein
MSKPDKDQEFFLDMSLDEALERLAGVDSEELTAELERAETQRLERAKKSRVRKDAA